MVELPVLIVSHNGGMMYTLFVSYFIYYSDDLECLLDYHVSFFWLFSEIM